MEPELLIKPNGSVILGIDNDCERGDSGEIGSRDRIKEQGAAKPAALIPPVYSEPANAHRGDGRISRKAFARCCGEILQHDRRCCQSVESRESARGDLNGDVAGTDAPTHVLFGPCAKIDIQRLRSRVEVRPVMIAQRFDAKWTLLHERSIRLRCAAAARFIAGVILGLRSAAANRS